jgi:hypothetical protein
MALPPPQAGRQPPTPGAKQRHNFAVLNAAGVSNLFTAAAAGLPAPAPVGAALRRAGLHCASIVQRRYGRRSCRAEGVQWGRHWAASMAQCTATATTATTSTRARNTNCEPAGQPAIQQNSSNTHLQTASGQPAGSSACLLALVESAGRRGEWVWASAGSGPPPAHLQQERWTPSRIGQAGDVNARGSQRKQAPGDSSA